uniref:Collagen-like protein 6 n=1 Tax=Zeugodacus cucurbitae TaxID=28588 RepID=A0A0A1XGJ5_ZEUCU
MAKKGKKDKKGKDEPADGGKKGKKGKKGRKSALSEAASVGKGKKGKGKDKRKKSKMSVRQSKAASAMIRAEPEPIPPPPPPPEPKCNDKIRSDDPCRYTEDACCKGAVACRPNHYPGILDEPERMAVVGSESGSYESLCKLVRAGMRCADRVFIMTPWGNYVIFRAHDENNKIYFIYDGCTCNVNRFRYLDLNEGTAGLLYFDCVHSLISYMMESKKQRMSLKRIKRSVIDDICKEFCEFGH